MIVMECHGGRPSMPRARTARSIFNSLPSDRGGVGSVGVEATGISSGTAGGGVAGRVSQVMPQSSRAAKVVACQRRVCDRDELCPAAKAAEMGSIFAGRGVND